MNPMDGLIGQLEWAAKNMAYNLDFIAEDKLDWKPTPTAKSALEIINHVVMPLVGMTSYFETGEFQYSVTPATNREEAKGLLIACAERYAEKLREVKPEELRKTVTLPFAGERPMKVAVGMPVIDLIHHHGQIAYIQTLLGDTEAHFQR